MATATDTEYRISPSETRYDAADVRAFITEALETAPAVERVQELLVHHVVGRHFHPSVVQATVACIIQDIVESATPRTGGRSRPASSTTRVTRSLTTSRRGRAPDERR